MMNRPDHDHDHDPGPDRFTGWLAGGPPPPQGDPYEDHHDDGRPPGEDAWAAASVAAGLGDPYAGTARDPGDLLAEYVLIVGGRNQLAARHTPCGVVAFTAGPGTASTSWPGGRWSTSPAATAAGCGTTTSPCPASCRSRWR